MSVEDELYIAQWQTTDPALNTVTPYRIRVLDDGQEMGHVDVRLLRNGADRKALPAGIRGVVLGATQPIKFRIETVTVGAPVVSTLGMAGGSVEVPLGGGARLTFQVPAGALNENVEFTFRPMVAGPGHLASIGIAPANMLFRKPVTFTISIPGQLAAGDAHLAAITLRHGVAGGLVLPTTQLVSGLAFTASTAVLGSPPSTFVTAATITTSPRQVRAAVLADDAGEAQIDLVVADAEARIAALLAAAAELDATRSFESAIKYRLAAAALAALIGSPEVDAALATAGLAACQKLTVSNNLAATRLGSEFQNLWSALRPVISWTASVYALGLETDDCPALADFTDVMEDLTAQFIELYTAAMERSRFPSDAEGIQKELYNSLTARRYGELLAMQAAFDDIKAKIQLPLAGRYRKAAYDWCRTDQEQRFMGPLFRAARDTAMYAIGLPQVSALRQGIVPAEDFGFDEDDLLDDIQYCGTIVRVQSVTAEGARTPYGPVGGGATPGSVNAVLAIDAPLHGKIELDSVLVALRCEDETIGNDRIFVHFNGTRIREIQRAGVTAHFLRSLPVVLDVDSLAEQGGVNVEEGGTFPLTLVRESNGCDGDYSLPGQASATGLITLNVKYPDIDVVVSPSTASVDAGQSRQFTATVTGTTETSVTWTATGGSVSAAGLYTAGGTAGVYQVIAKSTADTTASATATVTVVTTTTPPPPSTATVRVIRDSVIVLAGNRDFFSAVVTPSPANAVTWTATGGTITAESPTSGGLYTAGQAPGTYQVTATSIDWPGSTGTAKVIIVAAASGLYTGTRCMTPQSGEQSCSEVLVSISTPLTVGGKVYVGFNWTNPGSSFGGCHRLARLVSGTGSATLVGTQGSVCSGGISTIGPGINVEGSWSGSFSGSLTSGHLTITEVHPESVTTFEVNKVVF